MDNSITAKIVTEVQERQDGFIFSTIYPFCESVAEMRISKKELEDALLLWKNLVRCKDCRYSEVAYCRDRKTISRTEIYCIKDENRHGKQWYCADGERREEDEP